ncbi:MAG: hypothetical protein ACI9F9_003434 [Candidatus Paceibacteria bacterium]|jgi:hypothetical protein
MKKIILALLGSSLFMLGALATAGAAQDTKTAPAPEMTQTEQDQAAIASQSASYPLDTCVVSGEKFTAESPATTFVVEGKLVRTCCSRCEKKVKASPAAFIKKVDDAVIAQQKPLWPLTTCPVSGEAFGGEMGEPIDYVVGTRYAKLCCKGCIGKAKKDPAAFIEKLNAQVMPALAKAYPMDTCVVSDEKLGSMGEPIDRMHGHRLVRLCCKGCLKAFKKDPAGLVAKVYAPAQKATK